MNRRLALTIAAFCLALALIVIGIGLVFVPAGMVAAGLALLAMLTFDPAKVGRVTWPR
jgi:hypothetical protein